jgi:acid stress-induced BolA-like protein IbaG/YrbA
MEEQVKNALIAAGYTADEIRLETTPSGNVGGFVISPRFSGLTHLDRQDVLWDELRKHLSPDQLRRIVSILTMTPDEVEDDVRVVNG